MKAQSMRKMMKTWASVGLAILGTCLAGTAAATPLTLDAGQIASFTQLAATDGSIVTIQTTATDFTTVYPFPIAGLHFADVGLTGLAIGWADGDTITLNVTNNNEHEWNFSMWAMNASGMVSGAAVPILPGATANVGAALSAAGFGGAGDIGKAWLRVSSPIGIPNTNDDRTAEYRVKPATAPGAAVPEPGAMALFTVGTLVVAGSIRRQSHRAAQ